MSADAQLVSAWRAGDTSAGESLLRGCYPAVRRFFKNKGGPASEDLIQQTFARAVESRDRFEGRSSFRSYVLATARYVLYEHLRRLQRSPVDFGVSSIAALDPSPSQVVAEDEERQEVLDALRTIPVQQQILLELYYWEEMSITEVAEVLDIAPGTVKSRLHTARAAFEKSVKRNDLISEARLKAAR